MKILKIMAILLTVVAVVSTAGCTEKVQVAGNETQKASENVTDTAVPTTSVAKSVPSVMPSVKNNTDLTSSTVVDVVCKMKIDKNTAEFKNEYKGTIYYFCSASCKKKFDENPEKYINSENKENGTQEASEQAMSATTNSMDASSTVVDPVCKMEIDEKTAEFTSEYEGTTYYFCCASCKEKFDENPEKYVSSEISENNSETTENGTQEASEQITSAATNNSMDSTSSTVTQEVSEQVTSTATNSSTDSTSSTVVDIVCKMEINKNTAEFTNEYEGTTYYFCSVSCKEKFDKNPEKYVSSEISENNSTTTENETQEASEQVTSAATNSTDSTSSTVVDPVCKMEIDENTVEFKSEYKGTTYYFCALSCKQEFDENPEKYINSKDTEYETQKNCKAIKIETQKNCKTTEIKNQAASKSC
ncbi:MAG TPA: YHS domain-containing protein [Methanosarcina sp.]|jgi:YHS domain-containing protein